MDRFVVKESRINPEFSHGNHMVYYPTGSSSSMYMNDSYGAEPASTRFVNCNINNSRGTHLQNGISFPIANGPGQNTSGIDPKYLAVYSTKNASFIAGGDNIGHYNAAPSANTIGSDYQNQEFTGPERVKRHNFMTPSGLVSNPNNGVYSPQMPHMNRNIITDQNMQWGFNMQQNMKGNDCIYSPQMLHMNSNVTGNQNMQWGFNKQQNMKVTPPNVNESGRIFSAPTTHPRNDSNTVNAIERPSVNTDSTQLRNLNVQQVNKKVFQDSESKNNCLELPTLTRADKIKALNKTGIRVFSGPVEKVLKWHKSLQEIEVFVLFEVIGKCVNVSSGDGCAKHLVVRDENGPAMQVVYYEIDFLLPKLMPPCIVRVIGKMMPGTSRLQAYSVRTATGDDMAIFPRCAAVANHHVTKLCKEYGNNTV